MSQTIHSFIHSIIFFLSPVIPMIIYVSSASRDVTLDLGLVLEELRKKLRLSVCERATFPKSVCQMPTELPE